MHYILYEIGRNCAIQNKLYSEISEIIKNDSKITLDAIYNIKYLKCVVKEALRFN